MIHALVHNIEERLGEAVAAIRTNRGMTQQFVCGDEKVELKRRTLGRIEQAEGSTTTRSLILSSSRMNVHPAAFWNFSVAGNALFDQLYTTPCPFMKEGQCYFCNQTNSSL